MCKKFVFTLNHLNPALKSKQTLKLIVPPNFCIHFVSLKAIYVKSVDFKQSPIYNS